MASPICPDIDMEKTIICVVDRVEEGIAVCFPDDGSEKITFPVSSFGAVREGNALALTVTVQDDKQTVIHVRPATDTEHIDRKQENALRLRRLFDKNK